MRKAKIDFISHVFFLLHVYWKGTSYQIYVNVTHTKKVGLVVMQILVLCNLKQELNNQSTFSGYDRAFDRVWYEDLTYNMGYLKNTGKLVEWYLECRKFGVSLGNKIFTFRRPEVHYKRQYVDGTRCWCHSYTLPCLVTETDNKEAADAIQNIGQLVRRMKTWLRKKVKHFWSRATEGIFQNKSPLKMNTAFFDWTGYSFYLKNASEEVR